MATLEAGLDVDALRRQVRASQHARSIPLVVLGTLLVNYGSNLFDPSPVPWRYGAPLAFVLIWLVMRSNESRTGVGGGRADYLLAAGFVFAATNIVLVRPISDHLLDPYRVQGVWAIIVGGTLAGLATVSRDRVLGLAGAGIVGVGALGAVTGHYWSGPLDVLPYHAYPTQPLVDVLLAFLGVAMVLGGLVAYRLERPAG